MRRLLLTSDWHLSENIRDGYRWNMAARIRGLCEKHEVNDLFILGDLTDFPDHHSARFTNQVVDLLAGIAARCCVHVIRGNHDCSDPAVPFFRFINAIEGCRYIVDTMLWQVEDWRALLVPYGRWQDPLPDGINAVFTHHTFAGATAEHGPKLSGLRIPFTRVPIYSGDMHVPQHQGPVTYIGAPTHIRFGDHFQPRVLLLDIDDGKHSVTSTSMQGPTKRLVEVVAHPDGRIEWPRGEVNKGDIVKVRVSFAGEIPSLAHLRADIDERISKLGAGLYTIDVAAAPRTSSTPRNPVSRSDADLVRQYGAAHSLGEGIVARGVSIVGKP